MAPPCARRHGCSQPRDEHDFAITLARASNLHEARATSNSPSGDTHMNKRPWLIHVLWFLGVLVSGGLGYYLGGQTVGSVLGRLYMQNRRSFQFADIAMTVTALEKADPAFSRRRDIDRLRFSLLNLAYQDGEWKCTENDRRILVRAKTWLEANPDQQLSPDSPVLDGLRICDAH